MAPLVHRLILRYALLALLVPLFASLAVAKSNGEWCGTYPGQTHEELDLHRKSRIAGKFKAATSRNATRLDGNILILDDSDGVVARRNPFNLLSRSVTFTPSAAGYRFSTGTPAVDTANPGAALNGLGDDDTRAVDLPFPFPFYGVTYQKIFINSDGNLTFGGGDVDTGSRSIGRLNSGLPRIAGLFTDLDPSAAGDGVRVRSDSTSFTITWLRVREYSDFGLGPQQTFQISLSPNGNVTLTWSQINVAESVVGLSPGGLVSSTTLVAFAAGSERTFPGTVAERFGDSTAVDLVTASQKVYESQDDAYDYLAFFNTSGVFPGSGVIAFEVSVRARRKGIGDTLADVGKEYGSANRLQAVLNLGPVSQYPDDPNATMPSRAGTGDTGLTVVAHEAGHLFLAFASVREGQNRPMLGRQGFHWAFTFNSEASLLEGNRIEDLGEGASPRFRTTATVAGFSPLDQYLMGLRAPGDVPPTFYVQNSGLSTAITSPRVGATFGGARRDVAVDELITAEGRRTPDHTVEQRRYRIGFVLIVPAGTTPSATDLAKVERYRTEFERAWPHYSGGRAAMESTFRRNLRLSVEPAIGLLANRSATVTVALDRPVATPTTVLLRAESGLASLPASVTIPAGQTSTSFRLAGVRPGLDIVRAEGPASFAPVEARVQILPADGSGAEIVLVSNAGTPPIFRVQDANELPYPGLELSAQNQVVVTDADGRAAFPAGVETVTLAGTALSGGVPRAPALLAGGVVNAASFRPGLVAGGIATAFGADLRNASVTVGGTIARVFFSNATQINFAVPNGLAPGPTNVTARNAIGVVTISATVLATQPGIFFDAASGKAAAIPRGDSIYEVYGTGFGTTPVTARSGTRPVEVLFSGAAPGFVGLQQLNLRGLSPGDPLVVSTAGVDSNTVALP